MKERNKTQQWRTTNKKKTPARRLGKAVMVENRSHKVGGNFRLWFQASKMASTRASFINLWSNKQQRPQESSAKFQGRRIWEIFKNIRIHQTLVKPV
ncbi:hypothetical protein U1Q18_026234 [Sarracenia purpurea var. burkii]